MQNKLQELTDKLYVEGLSKGKQEAEEMVAKAGKEAAEIISKAKDEYSKIISKANKDAEDIRLKMEMEVKMASRQSLTALKNQIENSIVANGFNKPVSEITDKTSFLKSLIEAAIASFNPKGGDSVSLSLLLPENKRNELDSFLKSEVISQLKGGINIVFDNKITTGFKIGPKEEGYHISFTDKDLQQLFSEYLKPKTREFLFAE
jgi:V/A-type H+-transporting ATPase subunit E